MFTINHKICLLRHWRSESIWKCYVSSWQISRAWQSLFVWSCCPASDNRVSLRLLPRMWRHAKTPSTPAESSALTADSELEIILRLPQGKQLDILTKAPSFKLLAETLRGAKYERLRCDFPKREIRAEWFRDLPTDQHLALERLYMCVADKRMIKVGDEMTVNYVHVDIVCCV